MKNFETAIDQQLEHTGKTYERFVLGHPRLDAPEYVEKMRSLIEERRVSRKPIDFRRAIEAVRSAQPFAPDSTTLQDSANPVKQFPRSLVKSVADALGFRGEDILRVRFFTTLDTPLDGAGADAVIELAGRGGTPSRFLRLDLKMMQEESAINTARKEKVRNEFSHLPPRIVCGQVPEISDPRDISNPRSEFSKYVDGLADEAAAILGEEVETAP